MTNEQNAAYITQTAAAAADALTKVAAAEAAAVVEVAAAAHANLAPSVLVASMFETLQRQIEKVAVRLDEGNDWMARTERRADARHAKLEADVKTLTGKVEIQNGGVTRALNWMASHDARMAAARDTAFGRKAQREDDLKVVRGLQTFFKDFWPLILGAALGGIGVGSFLWNTLGAPW